MERKQIVKTVSEHFGVKAQYLGVPSFAYEIRTEEQTYTIDREGKIVNERGRAIELRDVLNRKEGESAEEEIPRLGAEETTTSAPYEIPLPLESHDGRALRNILNMIYSKQELIKKSLGLAGNLIEEDFITAINAASIITLEDFNNHATEIGLEKVSGITLDFLKDEMTIELPKESAGAEELFTLICKLAQKQKCASYKSKATTNEKYTFRTWLLRLGMIGDDYKEARRELLKNLSGNGAFKGGAAHEA
ncbi:virulence-related protein [Proteinivorax hydrogeniformans]|uniref:Virulence-related protein n=1 Tax=Proteinivorax hydrogeniformans TaxID=1826727 RepID=A0AAU8HT39_9FIRM